MRQVGVKGVDVLGSRRLRGVHLWVLACRSWRVETGMSSSDHLKEHMSPGKSATGRHQHSHVPRSWHCDLHFGSFWPTVIRDWEEVFSMFTSCTIWFKSLQFRGDHVVQWCRIFFFVPMAANVDPDWLIQYFTDACIALPTHSIRMDCVFGVNKWYRNGIHSSWM